MEATLRPTYVGDGVADQGKLREFIEAQSCPWCGREGLRSLANHTVLVHRIYAHELRELAGLAPDTPLCSPALSDRHRQLAREHDTGRWLHRPEVFLAAAATREASYDDEQRRRRVEQLDAIRAKAVEAFRQSVQAEKSDPKLAAQRRVARSKARRAFRPGVECPVCGAWFCSVVPVGRVYRQRRFCSDACRLEASDRARRRRWTRRALETWSLPPLEAE